MKVKQLNINLLLYLLLFNIIYLYLLYIQSHGIADYFGRLTEPVITYDLIRQQFGDEADAIIWEYLDRVFGANSDTEFKFKPHFNTEKNIAEYVRNKWYIKADTPAHVLKSLDTYLKKFWILTNSVCLYKCDMNK
ncbi:hypothetical protein EZS27_020566 [termite gut metagenome]|uniref:Uncharacterized protein n=1 Tax=termite gut metagenome TaxID=433724 RepID=A0A5J4RBM0_9ZZZZ